MNLPPSNATSRSGASCAPQLLIVLICFLLGLSAGTLVFFRAEPTHRSTAKLLVRYLIERSALDNYDQQLDVREHLTSIMEAEKEILTSFDLADEAVKAIGAELLVPNLAPEDAPDAAVTLIGQSLRVESKPGSNVITVSFRHRDASLATETLQELINSYFEKHLEIHRGVGSTNLLSMLADQFRTQLRRTEEDLKKKKSNPDASEYELEQLERQRAVELEQYNLASAALRKARIDISLGPKNLPNIAFIQRPSRAVKVLADRSLALAIGLAVGALLLGVILAYLHRRRAKRVRAH